MTDKSFIDKTFTDETFTDESFTDETLPHNAQSSTLYDSFEYIEVT